jgi:hypothetical protein
MFLTNKTIKICCICIIYIIVATCVLFYGKYSLLNPLFKDPLLEVVVMEKPFVLDGWSLTHFYLYIAMGYFFPRYIFILFAMGIIWELFEFYLQHTSAKIYLQLFNLEKKVKISTSNPWWHGSYSDFFVNALGLFIGQFLQR